jgi:hypothetical protein
MRTGVKVAHSVVPVAQLVYDAAAEILSGTIGQQPRFFMKAYSGGSRGHIPGVDPKLAAQYLHNSANRLSSHFANTAEVTDAHGNYKQRGGTLPAGHYRCHYLAHHPPFGECIWLHRLADAMAIHSPFSPYPFPHGRTDSFYIHGHGAKGSDGCIVPESHAERLRLNHAVKEFSVSGRVVLLVKNVSYILPAELEGRMA